MYAGPAQGDSCGQSLDPVTTDLQAPGPHYVLGGSCTKQGSRRSMEYTDPTDLARGHADLSHQPFGDCGDRPGDGKCLLCTRK